jgi:hypothetical protein
MRKLAMAIAAALALCVFWPVMSARATEGNAVGGDATAAVQEAFDAIARTGELDVLERLLISKDTQDSYADELSLNVEIPIVGLELEELDPFTVRYKCTIPSAAELTLAIVDPNLSVFVNSELYVPVIVEGVLPVLEINDEIYIDISAGDSPINLFFDLSLYNGSLLFLSDLSGANLTLETVKSAVLQLGQVVASAYGEMLGIEEYAMLKEAELSQAADLVASIIIARQNLQAQIDSRQEYRESAPLEKADSGSWEEWLGEAWEWIKGLPVWVYGVMAGLVLLAVLALNGTLSAIGRRFSSEGRRKAKIEKRHVASYDLPESIDLYREPDGQWAKCMWWAAKTVQESGSNYADFAEHTKAGWALAAMGKQLTYKLTPAGFQQGMQQYKKVAKAFQLMIEKLNKYVSAWKEADKKSDEAAMRRSNLKPGEPAYRDNEKEYGIQRKLAQKLQNKIRPLREQYDEGILFACLDAKAPPLGFLLHVLADNQWRYDRFLKQGAIMGLFDFLTAHKSDPQMKPHYEILASIKRELVSSAEHMSAFEVRISIAAEEQARQRLESVKRALESEGLNIKNQPEELKRVELQIDTRGNIKSKLPLGEQFIGYLRQLISAIDGQDLSKSFSGTVADLWNAKHDAICESIERALIEERAEIAKASSEKAVKLYAYVLGEVLRCANPELKYCDTEELIKHAIKEIPDVMALLRPYPLRLIDPGKQDEQGFYEFAPYYHAMWVQYEPPLKTGRVIRRFHEVRDMTVPNSTGLNVRLFSDPYRVIPTMFHEYCHYLGDRNEASVFLKTQLFSDKFYRSNPAAKPMQDFVFLQLSVMLGTPADVKSSGKLNELIQKMYGQQKTREQAQLFAEQRIARINAGIKSSNQRETWHPEITMPQLADEEGGDIANMLLIHDILMRYYTVPREISDDEFNVITQAGKTTVL